VITAGGSHLEALEEFGRSAAFHDLQEVRFAG
jgi:hypothetical protein